MISAVASIDRQNCLQRIEIVRDGLRSFRLMSSFG